ncbi:MAG TPA: DUF1572 family protein [Bryobacteraceae bacterium]|nr:DUF1572 family protein [Bryobacteraceae bacterium]
MIEQAFLNYSAEQLLTYTGRIEDCLARLSAEQVWMRGSDNQNAVGNVVLHLCGNVRQWIISGVGGQPDIRDRDAEFAARGGPQALELAAKLKATATEAAEVIRKLPLERLTEAKTIQKVYNPTIMEAIYHVVEHFAQHAGQIIYATKLLTSEDLGYYKHLSRSSSGA